MSGSYGWSYASKLNPSARRRAPRRNVYRPYAGVRARQTKSLFVCRSHTAAARAVLGRTGRTVVALALVVLSLIVIGKGTEAPAEATGWVMQWIGSLKPVPAPQTPSPHPAAVQMPESAFARRARHVPPAKPLAIISDGGLFVLDANGHVWPLEGARCKADLPVLTGLGVSEVPGEMGIVLNVQVDLGLVRQLLGVRFQDQLSEIHFGGPDGLVLYTRDGIKLLLRQGPELERSLNRLAAVLADIRLKDKAVAVIDLRVEQGVVVRPKQGG